MPNRRIRLNVNTFDKLEERAVQRVMRTGMVTQGKLVAKVEAAMLERLHYPKGRNAVMVNSGSSANLLAAALLRKTADEMRPGRNEVITPALTWATTVAPLIQHGFKPVFVDVGPGYTMDPGEVEAVITDRTIGILPVHLLGHFADMPALRALADRHDLWLGEDCCEALDVGPQERPAGAWGHAASFSFYFSHHASSIEGGLLIYPTKFHQIRAWREHGWIRQYPEGERDTIARMNPDLDARWIFDELGYNVRSTDLNAAIALVQLKKASGWWKPRRQDIAKWYSDNLRHDSLYHSGASTASTSNPFSYPLTIKMGQAFTRNDLVHALERAGVETRPIMTGDITQHPWYKRHPDAWRKPTTLHMTNTAHVNGFLLPCHPNLAAKDLTHIRDVLHRFLKRHTGTGLT